MTDADEVGDAEDEGGAAAELVVLEAVAGELVVGELAAGVGRLGEVAFEVGGPLDTWAEPGDHRVDVRGREERVVQVLHCVEVVAEEGAVLEEVTEDGIAWR